MIAAGISAGAIENPLLSPQGRKSLRAQPGVVFNDLFDARRSTQGVEEIGENGVAQHDRDDYNGDVQVACRYPQEYEDYVRGDEWIYKPQLDWGGEVIINRYICRTQEQIEFE